MRMKTKLAGCALLALCAVSASAQFTVGDMMKPAAYTNAHGNVSMYRISMPQYPKPGHRYPMILFLHGSGECGTNNYSQIKAGLPALMGQLLKQKEQVIVVAPQCRISNNWIKKLDFTADYVASKEPTLALRDALAICDSIIERGLADPNRFYITGLSLGGFGTWDAIQRYPEKFAAAAPICGSGDVRKLPPGLKKLPLWVAHGDIDENVPVDCSRRMCEAIHNFGNKQLIYEEFQGGNHLIWDRVYSDPQFTKWLLKQTRKEKKPWWKFW